MSDTEMLFAIIAIIATITPIICNTIATIFTNFTNCKIEKLKLFDIERIKSLNDFIEKSNLYFSISNSKNSNSNSIAHSDMIQSFLKLQIYFNLNDSIRDRLFKMERSGGYEEDWNFRNELIKNLSIIVNKYAK